ncbi:MAG: FAD-dependent oxidoreductase, partial [Rhodobacteraceae bacterium]|nr:FAD-dependent oxidoreductase [Paracoccaceae bacterium]
MSRPRITIFGAGIFGLSVAFFCLKKGAYVRVVEKRRVGAGASGGVVGALSPHIPENWNAKKEFQLESLVMAQDFWADVAAISGHDPGYARVGRLQSLGDDRAVALALARGIGADNLWCGKARWQVVPADTAGPWAPVSATGLLVHDTLSARVHPQQASAALAAAVTAMGGEITDTPPDAPGREVWATGHEGLAALSQDLGRTVGNGVKGQGALLALDRAGAPQLYGDGIHIVPHGDGTVAVGSTSERDFDDPDSTDAQLQTVVDKARQLCPDLAHAPVIARWAGVRPRARSRAPMLG